MNEMGLPPIRARQMQQLGEDMKFASPASSAPAPGGDQRDMGRLSFVDGAPRMPQTMIGITANQQSQVALQTNPDRGYLYIQNNSNTDILVCYDRDADNGVSLLIGPGGYYEPRVVPTNAISVATVGAATANVIIVEGTLRPK